MRREKKTDKRGKLNFIVGLVAIVLIAGAVVNYQPHSVLDDLQTPAPTQEIVATPEPTVEPTPVPTEAPKRENPLDGINLSAEEKRAVYDEIEAKFNALSTTKEYLSLSFEEQNQEDEKVVAEIGANHNISGKEAEQIYSYGSMGYLYDIDLSALKLEFGDLESVSQTGTTLVVKAKIKPSYSNEATINQNYFNIENLIQKQGCGVFSTISYWAVADMTSGKESKVIMFDVNKQTIRNIAEERIAAIQYKDYVTDLWIHPSLQS